MDKINSNVETSSLINNGGVNEDQLLIWRNKWRKISAIEVEDDGDVYVGYFRRPDMETLAAVSKLSKTDDVKAANALFENCWLGGASMLKEDAVLKMAAIGRLNGIMNVTRSEIKNL